MKKYLWMSSAAVVIGDLRVNMKKKNIGKVTAPANHKTVNYDPCILLNRNASGYSMTVANHKWSW